VQCDSKLIIRVVDPDPDPAFQVDPDQIPIQGF
jgi:hypothetical protein